MTDTKTDFLEAVARSMLFSGAPREELSTLLPIGMVLRFESGVPILRENESVQGLHLLIEGSVEIIKNKTVQIAQLGAGNFFGEISLFGRTYAATATVRAVTPCTMLVFDQRRLDPWLNAHPRSQICLYRNLATELCNRLHSTTQKFCLGLPVKS